MTNKTNTTKKQINHDAGVLQKLWLYNRVNALLSHLAHGITNIYVLLSKNDSNPTLYI